jgi:hypothetical protein
MKRKVIIFFVLFFSFLFFPLSKNQAQTITPSPRLTITPLVNNNKGLEVLVDLLKIILDNNQENNSTTNNNSNNNSIYPSIITPSITINISNFPNIRVTPDINGLVYYPQCNGPYDKYPLPNGGILCQGGCGPTTVAMILASYVDKKINPPLVVEEYRKKGYYLSSDGSYYFDAIKILKSYNLKMAPIFADKQGKTIDQIMTQFGEIVKNYQKSGWTFFALANFCDPHPCKDNPKVTCTCGHYFWIIRIDESLNIWAYDPAHDIKLPKPINHKVRYPFPKIKVLFAVKK